MKSLVQEITQTLTSNEVAEMVDRRHDQVVRDINNIVSHLGDHKSVESYFIPSTYTNSQNKVYPNFLLTKKGCELFATRMTGEKGTQFAVKYIERFNDMEAHIKKTEIDTSQLSPELQAFNNIFQTLAKQELATKQLENKVDGIKSVLTMNTLNWREKAKKVVSEVARNNGGQFQSTWKKIYSELELRARVNLSRRLSNLKDRAAQAGATKSEVNGKSNLDVIEQDNKLVEIFLVIVKELAIKNGIDTSDLT